MYAKPPKSLPIPGTRSTYNATPREHTTRELVVYVR